MSRKRLSRWPGFVIGLLLTALHGPAAGVEFEPDLTQLREISPRPGTVLTSENLGRYRHLLDSDFAKFVEQDFLSLTVGEPISFRPHQAFIFATQQHQGQPRLLNPGQLADFTQGLPFANKPRRDSPDAGLKLAWNMRYAYTGDSGTIPEMFWQLRDWRKQDADFEMSFEARTMRFMARHVEPPLPAIADNPQDAFGAFFLAAIDAGSYDDTQALVFANRDESREVNGWVYIPQLGRTQTLASFRTEESMFGSDILPTDFLVYAGRLSDMTWHFRGSSYLLMPFYRHDRVELAARKARSHDYWHVDFGGRAGCFPKVNWQLREVYILEGFATEDSAPARRRLLYIDAQTHVAALWKIYQRDERLWKFAMTSFAHPNSHLRSNNESGAPVPSAFSTIDITTNRCTTIQMLTLINNNEVSPKDFDAGRMQSGGGRNFRRR